MSTRVAPADESWRLYGPTSSLINECDRFTAHYRAGTVFVSNQFATKIALHADSGPMSMVTRIRIAVDVEFSQPFEDKDGIIGMSPRRSALMIKQLAKASIPQWPADTTQLLFNGAQNTLQVGAFDEASLTWTSVSSLRKDQWFLDGGSVNLGYTLVDTGASLLLAASEFIEAYAQKWPANAPLKRAADHSGSWLVPCDISSLVEDTSRLPAFEITLSGKSFNVPADALLGTYFHRYEKGPDGRDWCLTGLSDGDSGDTIVHAILGSVTFPTFQATFD